MSKSLNTLYRDPELEKYVKINRDSNIGIIKEFQMFLNENCIKQILPVSVDHCP